MLTQNCGDFGSFTYKMPDVAEYLEMLGMSGFTSSELNNAGEVNDLVLTAKMLKAAKILVRDINVKVGKKKLKDYDELLSQRELMAFMIEFVGKIQSGGDLEKK